MRVCEPLELSYSKMQQQREQQQDQQAEIWAMDLAELEQMLRRWGGRQLMRGVAQVYAEVSRDGSTLRWQILSRAYLEMHAASERDPVAGTTDEF